MDFRISEHAEKRIRQRKIKLEWIKTTLQYPEITENDDEDHTLAHAFKKIPEKGFRRLRVIYNETTKPVIIVTAYFE